MSQSTPQPSALSLEQALASLLSAPHITIPRIPGIPMGPGPVDLFSTIFNNLFTSDAKGLVDGEPVNRDGLKEKLLALQTHYNPDTVKFHAKEAHQSSQHKSRDEADVSFEWTTKDSTEFEVDTEAILVTQNGADKISFLSLKGKPVLFQKAGALSGEF